MLARKLGELVAQVEGIPPAQIELECVGEPAELGPRAILNSAVAGILARFLDGPVNDVSAPSVAQDRGITLREVVGQRKSGVSVIVLRARAQDGRAISAEGALDHEGGPRLLRWGDYEINAQLAGHAIVLFNADKPGVIGAVGTLLGQHGINVSQVHLGHLHATQEAVSMWTVDDAVSADVLRAIGAAPHVTRVVRVELS